jgi:FlaA1/EpsC-like NDP-sugar epimerase
MAMIPNAHLPNRRLTGLRMRYLMSIDLLCILIALVISFVIRYEALINVGPYLKANWILFVLAPLVRLPLYYFLRLYYRLWRYASTQELYRIVLASGMGSAIIYLLNFVLFPSLGLPYCPSRSIWVLEGVLSLGFLGITRFLLRILQERTATYDLMPWRHKLENPNKVLIVGAGDSGAVILREIQSNPGIGIKVVGLVDDDPAKQHMHIHDVPILGDRQAIPLIVDQYKVDQIIIAMPTAPGREIREIVGICERAGIHPRTIPGIYELIDGTVGLSQLRDIEIEDLLRREPVQTDTAAMSGLLRGRRVLVTGGGGSIGGELCRQIMRCRPSELILLGHGENSIFEMYNALVREQSKEQRLRNAENSTGVDGAPITQLRTIIADIRFAQRISAVFQEVRPHVVFHAAAHKHVHLMELNPAEAVTNNVLGTRNVLRAALAANVERFVMISSDKAVNPTSIMGASKRAAELLVHQTARSSGKPYVAVRFGNVLGSRGSVIHTFKEQIKVGGPITITDPAMQRYFMTIPEAVQLVLQAAALGRGGEVFLLDMGEPVKIMDLARDMIELSGLEIGRDIDIVFTGLRPGEKLFEELFTQGEVYQRTTHDKIFIAANASSFVPERLDETIAVLEHAAQMNDHQAIRRTLQNLIPEYEPPASPKPVENEKEALRLAPSMNPAPQL